MGQAPRPDGSPLNWKPLISLDGSPIEYSWKWNTSTSEPDVRYVEEPVGQFPGTELDPLNQQATKELLHRLAAKIPSVDINWVYHFLARFYDHDNSKYAQEIAGGAYAGTTIQIAVEHLPKGTVLKTYFFPRRLGENGLMSRTQWEDIIGELDPKNAARTALLNYLDSSPEGRLLTPFSLAIDNVQSSQSRLKWYFHTPHTSFSSVRDVMTLGGRISTTYNDKTLADLFELVKAVTQLPSDFAEDAEVPAAPQWDSSAVAKFGDMGKTLSGFVYYFDIAPGKALPEVKIFIPTRYYSRDDASLSNGLTKWMEARGRGQYCERYLRMLDILSEHRRLSDSNGLQTFVACLFKSNGELDITTYLGAEAFHSGRMAQRPRATRRRGDY